MEQAFKRVDEAISIWKYMSIPLLNGKVDKIKSQPIILKTKRTIG